MATIEPYETAKGKRYSVRYRKPDQSQARKSGFRTKRDAEMWLAENEVSKSRGEYIDPSKGKTTVGDLAPAWLADKKAHRKASTWHGIESAWRVHVAPVWGTRRISSIAPTEVRKWLAEVKQERSASTVLAVHGVLAGVLDDAVVERRILTNPCRDKRIVLSIIQRKKKRKHKYLTHAQVELVASLSAYPNTVRFLAYTGMRWGEMAGLRVENVDWRRWRVTTDENAVLTGGKIVLEETSKGDEDRDIPIPVFLREWVSSCAEGKDGSAVLFDYRGSHMRIPNSTTGWLALAVKKARAVDSSVPLITIHDLRHTAASLAISAGANVKAVQRMLGHKSAAMTLDIYGDLFDEDLEKVSTALNDARDDALRFTSISSQSA